MIRARSILLFGCLCLAFFSSSAQTTQDSLLLVAGSDQHLGTITQPELRKLFLGIPVTREGVRLRPLINSSDPHATRVFLQQVVFMSEREYKRQLLSRVFRLGGQRPKEYDDIDVLVEDLRKTPGALTFMWAEQVAAHEGLETLGVIWTSSVE